MSPLIRLLLWKCLFCPPSYILKIVFHLWLWLNKKAHEDSVLFFYCIWSVLGGEIDKKCSSEVMRADTEVCRRWSWNLAGHVTMSAPSLVTPKSEGNKKKNTYQHRRQQYCICRCLFVCTSFLCTGGCVGVRSVCVPPPSYSIKSLSSLLADLHHYLSNG